MEPRHASGTSTAFIHVPYSKWRKFAGGAQQLKHRLEKEQDVTITAPLEASVNDLGRLVELGGPAPALVRVFRALMHKIAAPDALTELYSPSEGCWQIPRQDQKPYGPMNGMEIAMWRPGEVQHADDAPFQATAHTPVVHIKLRAAVPLWLLAEHYNTPGTERADLPELDPSAAAKSSAPKPATFASKPVRLGCDEEMWGAEQLDPAASSALLSCISSRLHDIRTAAEHEATAMEVDQEVDASSQHLPDLMDYVMEHLPPPKALLLSPRKAEATQGWQASLPRLPTGLAHLHLVVDTCFLAHPYGLRILRAVRERFSPSAAPDPAVAYGFVVSVMVPRRVYFEMDQLKGSNGDVAKHARAAFGLLLEGLRSRDGFLALQSRAEYDAACKAAGEDKPSTDASIIHCAEYMRNVFLRGQPAASTFVASPDTKRVSAADGENGESAERTLSPLPTDTGMGGTDQAPAITRRVVVLSNDNGVCSLAEAEHIRSARLQDLPASNNLPRLARTLAHLAVSCTLPDISPPTSPLVDPPPAPAPVPSVTPVRLPASAAKTVAPMHFVPSPRREAWALDKVYAEFEDDYGQRNLRRPPPGGPPYPGGGGGNGGGRLDVGATVYTPFGMAGAQHHEQQPALAGPSRFRGGAAGVHQLGGGFPSGGHDGFVSQTSGADMDEYRHGAGATQRNAPSAAAFGAERSFTVPSAMRAAPHAVHGAERTFTAPPMPEQDDAVSEAEYIFESVPVKRGVPNVRETDYSYDMPGMEVEAPDHGSMYAETWGTSNRPSYEPPSAAACNAPDARHDVHTRREGWQEATNLPINYKVQPSTGEHAVDHSGMAARLIAEVSMPEAVQLPAQPSGPTAFMARCESGDQPPAMAMQPPHAPGGFTGVETHRMPPAQMAQRVEPVQVTAVPTNAGGGNMGWGAAPMPSHAASPHAAPQFATAGPASAGGGNAGWGAAPMPSHAASPHAAPQFATTGPTPAGGGNAGWGSAATAAAAAAQQLAQLRAQAQQDAALNQAALAQQAQQVQAQIIAALQMLQLEAGGGPVGVAPAPAPAPIPIPNASPYAGFAPGAGIQPSPSPSPPQWQSVLQQQQQQQQQQPQPPQQQAAPPPTEDPAARWRNFSAGYHPRAQLLDAHLFMQFAQALQALGDPKEASGAAVDTHIAAVRALDEWYCAASEESWRRAAPHLATALGLGGAVLTPQVDNALRELRQHEAAQEVMRLYQHAKFEASQRTSSGGGSSSGGSFAAPPQTRVHESPAGMDSGSERDIGSGSDTSAYGRGRAPAAAGGAGKAHPWRPDLDPGAAAPGGGGRPSAAPPAAKAAAKAPAPAPAAQPTGKARGRKGMQDNASLHEAHARAMGGEHVVHAGRRQQQG